MSDLIICEKNDLVAVANNIRTMTGTTGKLTIEEMATIQGGGEPVLQEKSVTPTRTAQTVVPDGGYDGLSKVEVDAIPSHYIVPSGTKEITENGTHDVTQYASVNVNVAGSGGVNYQEPIPCQVFIDYEDGFIGAEQIMVSAVYAYDSPSGNRYEDIYYDSLENIVSYKDDEANYVDIVLGSTLVLSGSPEVMWSIGVEVENCAITTYMVPLNSDETLFGVFLRIYDEGKITLYLR